MNMMKEVTPAQAYLNGMLYAAFCVKVISCDDDNLDETTTVFLEHGLHESHR